MTAAVITGASAGLGAEFTRQLVREFPDIEEFWLIARRVGKLEELAQLFPEKKFVCIGLNLLDPKSFRYLGEKLAEQKVDVRLLVNNAGCGTTGNIGASASSADVMRVVDLNVRALTMVTQTVVPFMTRGAKIINVSSIAAFCPTPRMTVYSASKAYVSAFTGGLADELRTIELLDYLTVDDVMTRFDLLGPEADYSKQCCEPEDNCALHNENN